ncbi:MAG: response regulator transcription factor [Acidiferrobacterales bacterium]
MSIDIREKPPMFRVLIVDDNAIFCRILREILQESFPFVVVAEAGDADTALKEVAATPPDLIFMDISLPDRSGLELTKQIRASHPKIVVAVVTTYDLPEYRQAAYENGARHFLSKKTFSAKDIEGIVESAFADKHPHVKAQMTLRRPAAEEKAPSADKAGPAPFLKPTKRGKRKRPGRPRGPKRPT